MKSPLFELMDDFAAIVNTEPVEKAPELMLNHAGRAQSTALAINALVRLLIIESARRRHAEARLLTVESESK